MYKFRISKNLNLYFLIVFLVAISCIAVVAQDTSLSRVDSLAFEKIIVEEYYTSDIADYTNNPTDKLPIGTKTYRIYVDLLPGYSLQMVYGAPNQELYIKTSTKFYNDIDNGGITGFNINAKKINSNNIVFDSWITLGAATRLHTGVLKSEDTDGSIITERVALKKSDGLTKGVLPNFKVFNIDLNFFNNDSNAVKFSTSNGGWAALGGVKGATPENRILIAQLTTNGILSFKLNIQVGTPTGGYLNYVADNPQLHDIVAKSLIFN
jgi:hypothetical protein